MDATVKINRLQLQIPGLTPPQARRLGREVARRLAERLPGHVTPQELGALELRLTAPPGASTQRLADLVVDALLKRIS
jgi:hypothetical protein